MAGPDAGGAAVPALAMRAMAQPADLNPKIIEALYCEALELADETRSAFDLSQRLEVNGDDEDVARIALSCEALRTTTRMMHSIAWLLNQRACFAGELSEFELRQQGRLPPAPEDGDPSLWPGLAPDQVDIIERTIRFYARIERIDRTWQNRLSAMPAAVHGLRERLGHAVHAL